MEISQSYVSLSAIWLFLVVAICVSSIEIRAHESNLDGKYREKNEEFIDDDMIEEFDRLAEFSRNERNEDSSITNLDNYPDYISMIMNIPKAHRRSEKTANHDDDSVISRQEIRLTEVKDSPASSTNEEKNSLFLRFAYIAREFYPYLRKNHDKKAKKNATYAIGQDQSEKYVKTFSLRAKYDDNEVSTTLPSINFPKNRTANPLNRNFIEGPRTCPSGHRRDSRGRCRKTIW